MSPPQRLFLAILLLVAVALLATSPVAMRLRRSRALTMLTVGGWPAIAIGVLLGPEALGVVTDDMMRDLAPLLMVGLGWIGLMIGLQARRDILTALPRSLYQLVLVDMLASLIAFGVVAWLLTPSWMGAAQFGEPRASHRVIAALAIACASIGWSMETRSLRRDDEDIGRRLSLAIRGGAGLGAITAVFALGVVTLTLDRHRGVLTMELGQVFTRLVASCGLAVAIGLIGRFALQVAGRDRPELLTVFLGLVALVAGLASEFGASMLMTAMLTGVVMANLAGPALRRFERFILDAEHVVAVLFALATGVLVDLSLGVGGVLTALALAALRVFVKPAILRHAGPALARRAKPPLVFAPARQAPVALAMGVALYVAEPSALSQQILTVLVLTGLLAEAAPLISLLRRREPARDAEPEGATP